MRTSDEKRAQVRACLRKRKERLKEAGLCQDCGQCEAAILRTLCTPCLKARRKRSKIKRDGGVDEDDKTERLVALIDILLRRKVA